MELKTFLKNIADAIRGKEGSSAPITAASFPARISAIPTGTDTSDATAGAGDILSGKAAYSKGQRIEGTIPSKGADSLSASGATVTVPAGYYPSEVSRTVDTATQATPAISVGSNGLITASAVQNAGYVSAGTKSADMQMDVKGADIVTPGAATKIAVPAGKYTTGDVAVLGDANLIAENVKNGVSIFGVTGNLLGIASESPPISGNGRAYYGGLTAQVRPVDVTLDRENNRLLVSFNIFATYSSTRAEGSGAFQIDLGV